MTSTNKRVVGGFLMALAAAFGFSVAYAQDAEAPALPELTITLAPGGLNEAGDPAWIDLKTRVSGMDFAAGEPFMRIPAQFAGVPGVAYGVDDLQIVDDQGAVAISTTVDDPDEGGFIYFRRFTTQRATEGTVTVSYRAPIRLQVPKLGAGPPFDLRSQGGGFSGAGNTFILMPDTSQPFMIGIDWKLEELKPGSIGVSSFGQGNTRSPGPVDRIIASYFMAGPIGHYPPDARDAKFSGYWIGSPKFDAADILQWSEKAYGYISGYFDDEDPPAYRVLMRGNPYPGGGGAALMSSFLVSYPDSQEDGHSLRETIAHETVHNWVTSIGGPPGSSSWYSEGMTVALTRRILLRSGLFSPEEFLESVNDSALSYYTNALNHTPNDEIAAGFWRDTRIRSLPYSRGSIYFADVDAAVRQKSGGKRSLDDLARTFNERREAGEEVSGETWRELVSAELGESGSKALDAMLAGELIVPPSDTFGPCFVREQKPVRRFELGFTRESMFDEPRVVSGLVAGSEAEKAGIREGDTILQPVPLEAAQSDPEKTLTLQLSRDGENLEVEYLPRGDAVTTYLWKRVAEVPDIECAL
ncbi:MAG TPA: hypothetical protein VFG52_03300 [Xanthomonadales bacterium]|nr:hypothetical protein [Xanthomonadales bacterium]